MSTADAGRFKYAHGLVWDAELGQPVLEDKTAHIAGQRIAELAVWDPFPRRVVVYSRALDGRIGWQHEDVKRGR